MIERRAGQGSIQSKSTSKRRRRGAAEAAKAKVIERRFTPTKNADQMIQEREALSSLAANSDATTLRERRGEYKNALEWVKGLRGSSARTSSVRFLGFNMRRSWRTLDRGLAIPQYFSNSNKGL